MSKEEIHFSPSITLKSFETIKWDIGKSYDIEFFDGIHSTIILLDSNYNINDYIHPTLPNDIIFVDSVGFSNNQYSLFSFYYQSNVYLILLTISQIDDQFSRFVSAQNGLQFTGLNIKKIKKRLKVLYGPNFNINIKDFMKEYLPQENISTSFYEIINKYIGQPKVQIDVDETKLKSDISNLYIPQVITSSLKVVSLSLISKSASSHKKIQFSAQLTLEKCKSSWQVGETYDVEFFKGTFTPVHLIDANSDLTEYLQKISKEPIIFVDFKSVQSYVYSTKLSQSEQKKVPLVCLFSFCCSSDVYIFKQVILTPNDQLKKFLSVKSGNNFVGLTMDAAVNKLCQFFAPGFSFDYEDVSKSRLSAKNDPSNFNELTVKYFKQPAADFNSKEAKNALWYKNPLPANLILNAAFKVLALSKCYAKFPSEKVGEKVPQKRQPKGEPPKKKPQNLQPKANYKTIPPSMVKSQPKIFQKGEIHFASESDFDGFQARSWVVGDAYNIEFFPSVLTPVVLLDACCDISHYVAQMKLDPVVFVDLEYVMPFKRAPPVCLFQFCSSSGAFLFKQSLFEVNLQLRDFLAVEGGCKFIGKGVSGDIQRLKEFFGETFEIDLEDVENTRLLPYDDSANFDQMVLKFAGQPMAQFKDKKVSRSNWNLKTLSMKQIIYSAFDVVSLFNCYPSFPPPRNFLYKLPADTSRPSNVEIMKAFSEFVKEKKGAENDDQIMQLWNSNPNLAAEMLGLDLKLLNFVVYESLKITLGHKVVCKICQKPSKYLFPFNLIDHCVKFHPQSRGGDVAKQSNFKELFVDYLFATGRVVLGTNKCLIYGDESFASKLELEDHCWNEHFDLLNEFLKKKNKSKDKNHKNDNDNDNDEDDDNDDDVEDDDNDDDDDDDVNIDDDDD